MFATTFRLLSFILVFSIWIPFSSAGSLSCADGQPTRVLALVDVIHHSLCNNPQTREAWANARYQAAQVGVAESAYLPSLNLSGSVSRNQSGAVAERYNQTSATLSLSYLLTDFGGRDAALESARQVMFAANATENATLQAVYFSAVQAYFRWYAAQAVLVAAHEAERASLESFKAANARYLVGVATPADKLQAQTAASQATLTRIRAEGDLKAAQGVLATVMGFDANQALNMAPPPDLNSSVSSSKNAGVGANLNSNSNLNALPSLQFEDDVNRLINEAKRTRPDLVAGEAQVLAAEAGISSARAAGRPSVSLFANRNFSDTSVSDTNRSTAVGVSVNIPLFSGFSTTYRVRAAEAQLETKRAQRDKLAQQVSLDVWQAYYALLTEGQAVRASKDLLASADQSAKVAFGRYKAGVGGILDVLNAQSALANARQQEIQSAYSWRIARVALAQAVGRLELSLLTPTNQSGELGEMGELGEISTPSIPTLPTLPPNKSHIETVPKE